MSTIGFSNKCRITIKYLETLEKSENFNKIVVELLFLDNGTIVLGLRKT